MQKSCTEHKNGVGIYRKRKSKRNQKENATEDLFDSPSSSSIILKDNDTRLYTQLFDYNVELEQLDSTQQVLNVLGDQINSLNALQHSNNNGRVSSEYNYTSKENFGCHVSIDELILITRRSTPKTKQHILDYYIKHNIEDSGGCGCHFEHNNEERSNLLNKLEKSYKKSYLDIEYKDLTRSKSESEVSNTDSYRNNTLPAKIDHKRHNILGEETDRQINHCERLNHGLFIDREAQRCHSSLNSTEKDSIFQQVGTILDLRQGPCCNYKAERHNREYSWSSRQTHIDIERSKELHDISFASQQENCEPAASLLINRVEGSLNNSHASLILNKYKLHSDHQSSEEEEDIEESEEAICETTNALESLADSLEEHCIESLLLQEEPPANKLEQQHQAYNSYASEPSSSSKSACCAICLRLRQHPLNERSILTADNYSSILSLSYSSGSQCDNNQEQQNYEFNNILDDSYQSCTNYINHKSYTLNNQNQKVGATLGSLQRERLQNYLEQDLRYCSDESKSTSAAQKQKLFQLKRRPPLDKCYSCEDLAARKMGIGSNESSKKDNTTARSEFGINKSFESKSGGSNVTDAATASPLEGSSEERQTYTNSDRFAAQSISLNSNFLGEEEAHRLPKHDKRGLSSVENVKSMRALKDIAKMSVPSLSSLQYLPSQIKSTQANTTTTATTTTTTNKRVATSIVGKGEPIKRMQDMKNANTVRIITESNENLKHDETCLLHRLCLCNCMARNHHYDQSEAEGASTSRAEVDGENQSEVKSPGKNAHTTVKSKSCLSESSNDEQQLSDKSAGFSRTKKKSGSMTECEKQSPSFMSLLRSTSSSPKRLCSSLRNNRTSSKHTSQQVNSRGNEGVPSRGGLESGSAEELTARSDRNSTTTTDESGSSFLRARSTSFNSSRNQQASPLSSLSEDVSDVTRPQSACSIREDVKSSLKRGASYRKILSPSRLFSSSSNNKIEEIEQQKVSLEPLERKDAKSQKSFFSRSFSRLSNRKKRSKKSWFGININESQPQLTDLNELSRTCISPAISISTVDIDASLEDSATSLDDTTLPLTSSRSRVSDIKSHLLLSPENTRNNKVEYLSADNQSNLSAISCDMTRAKSYKYHNARRINYNGGSRNGHWQQARYGSEISGFTTTSDNTGSERACSLPPSPHSRRRRNAPVGKSRSPRLTHSPVPFHSPASESTKIEDGLKVCSSEHFEKHIGNIKENQLEAQKRLFKAWINHFCPNLIRRDLVEELQDGIKLIGMLAYLTRDKKLFNHYDKLISDKQSYINRIVITPSSRLRHLSNVSIAIDYLRSERKMKLINLNPMDIVSGKANVILGLCWNIILNFQLEQNFLKDLESCEEASQNSLTSEASVYTSRLNITTNEECARYVKQTIRDIGQPEEYAPSDLVKTRKRLLNYINRRFNLKLTNNLSNLLDGEVLFVIIKNLIPECNEESQLIQNFEGKQWKSMNNDERCDHCFDLALMHLNVPRLFSSADLRHQTIADNNSKPLLVYLTMLLSADPKVKIDREWLASEPQELDESLPSEEVNGLEVANKIEAYLDELERDDRFEVDKLQLTLSRIKKLDNLLKSNEESLGEKENLKVRYLRVKEEAEQVESLISWINQADILFETPQKSAQDLTNSIEKYKVFFSPSNVPQVKTALCPSLERQYRECLSTAQQRVLLMEQTLKNWISYEKARKLLRDWLVTAEVKLTNALLPVQASFDDESDQFKPIDQHTDRLEDLIDYFELEPIDSILDESVQGHNDISSRTSRRTNLAKAIDNDGLPLSLSLDGDKSGSLLSICSASSRMSTLQSCKRASYYKLFDDFELKCRLLAAMLDSSQREALLLGVKELRSRLKYITEQRVPQVVSELKWNINRCEMTIEEQDESSDIASTDDKLLDLQDVSDDAIREGKIYPNELNGTRRSLVEIGKEVSTSENEDLRGDSGCFPKFQELSNLSPVSMINSTPTIETVSKVKELKGQIRHRSSANVQQSSAKPKNRKNEEANRSNNNKNVGPNATKHQATQSVVSHGQESSWSFFSWLLSREPTKHMVKSKKPKSRKALSHSKRNKKSRGRDMKVNSKKVDNEVSDGAGEWTYTRLFWSKVVRAYRASFSLNIVLLICLAGICVVPLIHKDACCDITSSNIPPRDLSLSEKPI